MITCAAGMSRAGELGSASDAEIRATFSLLPHVTNITRVLAGNQADSKVATQKAVGELQYQLQRCQNLLQACPYLDLSPEEQKAALEAKKQLLQQKSELLRRYKELAVLR